MYPSALWRALGRAPFAPIGANGHFGTPSRAGKEPDSCSGRCLNWRPRARGSVVKAAPILAVGTPRAEGRDSPFLRQQRIDKHGPELLRGVDRGEVRGEIK